MAWLQFVAWTIVAVALVVLDRKSWRAAPAIAQPATVAELVPERATAPVSTL